jgi:hypothetical protein
MTTILLPACLPRPHGPEPAQAEDPLSPSIGCKTEAMKMPCSSQGRIPAQSTRCRPQLGKAAALGVSCRVSSVGSASVGITTWGIRLRSREDLANYRLRTTRGWHPSVFAERSQAGLSSDMADCVEVGGLPRVPKRPRRFLTPTEGTGGQACVVGVARGCRRRDRWPNIRPSITSRPDRRR